jgi:hypothetical protein
MFGHVSPATKEHAIMGETFSVRSVPWLYNEGQLPLRKSLGTAVNYILLKVCARSARTKREYGTQS